MLGGVSFLFSLLVLLPPSLLVIHEDSPEVQNFNPQLRMIITVSDPNSDGLYLDNQWVHIAVNVTNISDQPVYLNTSGDFKRITSQEWVDLDQFHDEARLLAPKESKQYKIDQVLFAGNYRLYMDAGVVNGTTVAKKFIGRDAVGQLYLTISTQQDVFLKRTTDQNTLLMIITGLGVGGTILGIFMNHLHNERQRKDSKAYVDRQLQLQVASNKALQESNRLTQESLRLKQVEMKSMLGEPQIELLIGAAEQAGGNPQATLYPNFKNEGKVPASNIKIHYKVFDRTVTLDDIVRREAEIKNSAINVEGSIAPGKSVNLHTSNAKNKGIEWSRRKNPITIAVWFTYQYLDNQEDEVLFSTQYTDIYPDNAPTLYKSSNLEAIRQRLRSEPADSKDGGPL